MSETTHRACARRPSGSPGSYTRLETSDDVAGYLEDAAHYPGGVCREVCLPESEADVADIVTRAERVLPIGVQSSLTGGATPQDSTVIATSRMSGVLSWSGSGVQVQAGCVLAALDAELIKRDFYYPPAPTFDGATVGGTVSTNAAGAATFKYGTTRDWVRAISVVLADGDVLELRRGDVRASADGHFEIEKTDGSVVDLRIPSYEMPNVPKRSAGYHAEAGMDLIDLFIGAEGTLGMILDVELALKTPRPGWLVGLVQLPDDAAAVALVDGLRRASSAGELDVVAIEYMDARCLELLGEDGHTERLGFGLDPASRASILYQIEVDAGMSRGEAERALAQGLERGTGPFAALVALLEKHALVGTSVHALPGDDKRRNELFALREAVPEAVNRRIKQAQRDVDRSITKSAADVIVPFERFEHSLAEYRRIADAASLDLAIWGHISDGNVHPNLLPQSAAQMKTAREALLSMGTVATGLAGCPMSEHGVGRNPIKQELLRGLYGDDGIAQMKRIKQALDPAAKFSPGVLFPV